MALVMDLRGAITFDDSKYEVRINMPKLPTGS